LKARGEVQDLKHQQEVRKVPEIFEIMETAVMLDVISKHEGKKA
jgi:hypothetical protein